MKQFVLFSIFLILFTTCQKENFNIPDTGRKIVINGLITTDNFLNTRISKSAYITDKSRPSYESLLSVNDAEVFSFRNSICIDSLYYNSLWKGYYDFMYKLSNYWSRSVFPLPGEEYEIVVKVPGLPDATAVTKIPELIRIENVDTSHIHIREDIWAPSNVRIICNIEFTDPGSEKNYYLFTILKRNPYYDFSFFGTIAFDSKDPVVEEKLTGSVYPLEGIVFSDKLINGQKYSLTVTVDGNTIGRPFYDDTPEDADDHKKTIIFRLFSVTEEYYRYIKARNLCKENYGNPLAEPVLMPSNITGGYGIFSGAAVSSDSIVFQY